MKKPGWDGPGPGDDMLSNNAVSGSSAPLLFTLSAGWSLLQHALMSGQGSNYTTGSNYTKIQVTTEPSPLFSLRLT